ncbi:MAG: hypothetical protein VXY56_10365, partial [Pseudomonadota bacterium]|nr:hypothetical protein [Pseudomonadota bacterium]
CRVCRVRSGGSVLGCGSVVCNGSLLCSGNVLGYGSVLCEVGGSSVMYRGSEVSCGSARGNRMGETSPPPHCVPI